MNKLEDHIDRSIQLFLNNLNLFDYTYEIPSDSTGKTVTASLANIKVRGKYKSGKEIDLHLVVKKAPVKKHFRKVHATRIFYLREIYAYEAVFPSFRNLEKMYYGSKVFKSYPNYISSSKTEYQEFVMLQNMKVFGFEHYVKETHVDIEHALLLAKELGKLHASSFALRKKQPHIFRDICDNVRDIEYHSHFDVTSDYAINFFCQRVLRSLEKDCEAYKKFDKFRKQILNVTKKVLMEVVDSEYSVFTHGDFWIPNLLFKYHQDGNPPSEVCILDWQFLRIGSPTFDIAQLLFSCCDETIRNKYYRNLLEVYYESLKSCLNLFGEDAEDIYPYSVLIKHLKKYSVVGLMASLRTTYLSSTRKEHIPDTINVRNVKECFEMFDKAEKNDESYKKIMKNIILDYINLDYDM
ncbi:hypothetical protein FQR65_LT11331 [Abscondita terminalis]|nr:hypothetical protein FQR65_LT11331 [Abscondita terminalis]